MAAALVSHLRPHFDRRTLVRGLIAGSAWGLVLALGFFGIAVAQCGLPCPDDMAMTTLTCVGTGWLTIGPLVAFAK
jgi:hypothetical protein